MPEPEHPIIDADFEVITPSRKPLPLPGKRRWINLSPVQWAGLAIYLVCMAMGMAAIVGEAMGWL